MRVNSIFILISLFFLSLTACNNDNDDKEFDGPAPRTVLIYFAGDNSLRGFVSDNMDAIKRGIERNGLNNGNLLVYTDDSYNQPQLSQLKLEGDSVRQILIESFNREQNSASKETLSYMIKKVKEEFPADRYGLVLWSHGTGWLPADVNGYLRSFGQDGKDNFMELEDLSSALSGHHFDFILFDACYMACTEVAYALRSFADYIIASPTEILANGFPYESITDKMFEREANVIGIASEFYNYYNNKAGTISVVKCDELDNLAAVCNEIFKDKGELELFSVSVDKLQMMEYLTPNLHALYDFDDYVSQLATPEQYDRFKQAMDRCVIYKATTPKAVFAYPYPSGTYLPVKRFSGLSIYVPQMKLPKLNRWYMSLDWYKDVY